MEIRVPVILMLYLCNMKQIEKFLNHLYYTVFLMTDGTFSSPSPLNTNKFAGGTLSNGLFHGLSYFYIFDTLLFLLTICEYISGYSIMGVIKNEMIFAIVILALIFPIDEVIFHYFVYRNNKYVDYCREFEKESKLTKMMWSLFVIALFVSAIIIFILIFRFRQMYIPKPI